MILNQFQMIDVQIQMNEKKKNSYMCQQLHSLGKSEQLTKSQALAVYFFGFKLALIFSRTYFGSIDHFYVCHELSKSFTFQISLFNLSLNLIYLTKINILSFILHI